VLPEWTRRVSANEDGERSRKRPRTRSVRTRIAVLLVIPLLSLVALWAFAANVTIGAALNKYAISTTYDKIDNPGAFLSIQVQQERALSAVYLGSHKLQGLAQLREQRARTDAAQAYFRKNALSDAVKDTTSAPNVSRHLTAVAQKLDQLGSIRDAIDSGQADALRAITDYSEIIDVTYQLLSVVAVFVDDLGIFQQGRGLITVGSSCDYMLREDALIAAVQLSGGRMTLLQHTAFVQWSAAQRQTFDAGISDLDGTLQASVLRVAQSPESLRYRAMENAVVNSSPTVPKTPARLLGGNPPATTTITPAAKPTVRLPASVAEWQSTITPLALSWKQAITEAGVALTKRAQPIADGIMFRLALAGGLGLLAVLASIILSILFIRNLSRELVSLQHAARDLADERLPRVVARLRRGEDVDVDAEAPPLRIGKTTEISRVADAFTGVQRTAIDTAVGEAYLRKGVSRVFLNLAWRSQSLLHRQLRMLDAMERRASEPEELEDLFRLDHLTTRMRRHAEGLVILSGAPAGRGWSRPVRIVDVLRGALGEVEDYTRVDVVSSSPASLAAAAVADVIHLLAELIENATAFSPPPTEVVVRGELVANGFAVEIVDRGIGLSSGELDELNQRLVHPPEFDLADSDRLGLFVVSRLAARHDIRVTLQESAYGGTTAVVLIPRELVIQGEESELETPADQHGAPWRPQPAGPAPIPVASGPQGWFEPRQITGSTIAESAEDDDELPRRIRQANLVPQLRKEPKAPPGKAEAERRPEETRDLMASLQTGWLRGRGDEEEDRFRSEQGKEGGDS
jgi:signal transduction histidine kinase